MAKRRTKAQVEAERRSALFQRVRDIYSGGCGRGFAQYEETEASEWASAEELSRIVPALRDEFRGEPISTESITRNEFDWLFLPHNLGHFGTPGEATEFMFDKGVRA